MKSSRMTGTRVIRTGPHMGMKKSGCCCVEVMIEGVPVTGLIDTGSDITIIRGDLLYHIVGEANLEMQSLKTAEQKACTYDQKPISLDGQIDLKICFGKKEIVTTVYVKLVAPDQLLLSETVCRLLGIVSYHPRVKSGGMLPHPEGNVPSADLEASPPTSEVKDVQSVKGDAIIHSMDESSEQTNGTNNVQSIKGSGLTDGNIPSAEESSTKDTKGAVPPARVRLVSTVRLPACHSATVPVQVEEIRGPVLIEASGLVDDCLQVDESLVEVNENGSATLLITNNGKSLCHLKSGIELAHASEVDLELSIPNQKCKLAARVDSTSTKEVATTQIQLPSELDTSSEEMPPLQVNSISEQEMLPADQYKLWMVSSLPSDTVSSNERIQWRQQQLKECLMDAENQLSGDNLINCYLSTMTFSV